MQLIDCERPDIAFLDIAMPGLSGIEVARKAGSKCRIVFITAYDKYAVEAFESEAVDYLLKPVSRERLGKTVKRLQASFAAADSGIRDLSSILDKVSSALREKNRYLQWIKAQQGTGVRLIPVAEVCYFKATDKYTTVRTRDGETLIRKTIKELEEEIDPEQFWRVHRGTIVNVTAIGHVKRSLAGTCSLTFKDIADHITVSRAYSHLFKQM
jgi:DNA-binding LytR/AlgR family response regulator